VDTSLNWRELLQHPAHDHLVQFYRDADFLGEAVTHYVREGLHLGEAALVIARPEHRRLFAARLGASAAVQMLDAEQTLATFMVSGMPQWSAFQRICGSVIRSLRLQSTGVRAYGEMVDILWQRGERKAALRLEEFWNDLRREEPFSLLCAYAIDPLEPQAYGGPLESVCRCHTHLIPARDYARFNQAVMDAAKATLDQPLAQMLLSLAARYRPQTEMPLGQAALIWLKQNMPRSADRVLENARQRLSGG
jgi:hypothetical protein